MKILALITTAIWEMKISVLILGYISYYHLLTMSIAKDKFSTYTIIGILSLLLLLVGLLANIINNMKGNSDY